MLLDKQYGFSLGWWDFGILIYQLLRRQSPSRGEDEDAIYDAFLHNEPPVFNEHAASYGIF